MTCIYVELSDIMNCQVALTLLSKHSMEIQCPPQAFANSHGLGLKGSEFWHLLPFPLHYSSLSVFISSYSV